MTMHDEVELKLGLRTQDADVLEVSGLLGVGSRKARQRSVYFDTPDHCLVKAGLSLRIRRSGSKRTQPVQAIGASSAALSPRAEWDRAVRDDAPSSSDRPPTPPRPRQWGARTDPCPRVW